MLEYLAIMTAAVILLAAGLWVPFVIAGASILMILIQQGTSGLKAVGMVTWSSSNSFTLTAIPLFILMAEVLLQSGLASRLYRGLSVFTGLLPGGLLQTNILGCAMFSAISGSSVATAAAIGTVAIPEQQARNYDMRMAYGSLAAGGTLGILIPPSIAFIIYGSFTDISIVKLFAAGMLPGLALTLIFSLYVGIAGRRSNDAAAAAPAASTSKALLDTLPVILLIVLVLGALYSGWTTPTEAAGVGAVLAVFISMAYRQFSPAVLHRSLRRTLRSSTAILFVVITAYLFSYAIAISGATSTLTGWLVSLDLGRTWFIIAVALIFVGLGLFIESIAMIVITVPLLAPMLANYGIDPIWFGVFLVILIELGQITPPFGLNLFVIQGVNNARFSDVVRGTIPYYVLLILFMIVLFLVPSLALWLPSMMG
jgi:tripartite ATP-independent transporter DctM subunit